MKLTNTLICLIINLTFYNFVKLKSRNFNFQIEKEIVDDDENLLEEARISQILGEGHIKKNRKIKTETMSNKSSSSLFKVNSFQKYKNTNFTEYTKQFTISSCSNSCGKVFSDCSCESECEINKNCCSDYSTCKNLISKNVTYNETANCQYFSINEQICLQCDEDYYNYLNECVDKCPDHTQMILNNQICVEKKCDLENCENCENNERKCEKCFNGKFLVNGTCEDYLPFEFSNFTKNQTNTFQEMKERKDIVQRNNQNQQTTLNITPSTNNLNNISDKNFTKIETNVTQLANGLFINGEFDLKSDNGFDNFGKKILDNLLESLNVSLNHIPSNEIKNNTQTHSLNYLHDNWHKNEKINKKEKIALYIIKGNSNIKIINQHTDNKNSFNTYNINK